MVLNLHYHIFCRNFSLSLTTLREIRGRRCISFYRPYKTLLTYFILRYGSRSNTPTTFPGEQYILDNPHNESSIVGDS